jgi:hypothetical protein
MSMEKETTPRKVRSVRRLFSPDAKCQACPFLGTPEEPVWEMTFEDGTVKKLHGDCQKA